MKYILVNIRNFIMHETTVFLLCVMCIFCSSVVVNFSFGFYHHLEQKRNEEMSDIDDILIEFRNEGRDVVTKGSMVDVLLGIDEKVLKDCGIGMELHFEQYRSDDPIIDHSVLFMPVYFAIDDGKITGIESLEADWIKSGYLIEGNCYTAEQVENGEYVCIIPPHDYTDCSGEEDMWMHTFAPDANGFCTIDGKKYEVIGKVLFDYSAIPMVPITTVDDDCFVKYIDFSYKKPVTRNQYNQISTAIKDAYGDMAIIPDLDIPDIDSQRFYNTLILLAVLLAMLAGIVLAMLYEYIILQRKKSLTVYRLCGISKGKAVLMYFFECLILTTAVYGVGVLIYEKLILPYLSNIFEYITESYSLKVYSILGILYVVTVLCVLLVIIKRQIKDNIANELRGI